MKIAFNPGDKVKLRSGGPEMTIRGTHFDVLSNRYSENMFDCIWFARNLAGKEEVHYCPFQGEELVKIKSL